MIAQTAAPDRPPVNLDHGEDATGGAAEEDFVGGVEIVRGQVPLRGRDAQLGRDLEDGLAGDPLQDAAARGVERTAANEEDVRAAALGEQATVVEQDDIVGVGALGLQPRQMGVHAIEPQCCPDPSKNATRRHFNPPRRPSCSHCSTDVRLPAWFY